MPKRPGDDLTSRLLNTAKRVQGEGSATTTPLPSEPSAAKSSAAKPSLDLPSTPQPSNDEYFAKVLSESSVSDRVWEFLYFYKMLSETNLKYSKKAQLSDTVQKAFNIKFNFDVSQFNPTKNQETTPLLDALSYKLGTVVSLNYKNLKTKIPKKFPFHGIV